MDALRIHLMLNYYPVIGMFIGVVFILIGFWRKSDRAKRISLWIFFASALIALPAFVTGEVAGKAVEYVGPTAAAFAVHKETARMTIVLLEITGLAALAGLVMYGRGSERVKWIVPGVLVLSIAACGLTEYTVYLGRQVKWAATSSTIVNSEHGR